MSEKGGEEKEEDKGGSGVRQSWKGRMSRKRRKKEE